MRQIERIKHALHNRLGALCKVTSIHFKQSRPAAPWDVRLLVHITLQ